MSGLVYRIFLVEPPRDNHDKHFARIEVAARVLFVACCVWFVVSLVALVFSVWGLVS